MVDATTAFHLTAAGFKVEAKEFGLPAYATSASEQETAAKLAMEEASNSIKGEIAKLDSFIAALRTRLTIALQCFRDSGESSPEAIAETDTIAKTLTAVGSILPAVHQIGRRLRPFALLAQNRGNHSSPGTVDAQMNRLADELRQSLNAVQLALRDLSYPFPHPRGQLSVVDYARYEKKCANEWETVYRESNSHLDRLFALHYRLLGRLLVITSSAERELDRSSEKTTAV